MPNFSFVLLYVEDPRASAPFYTTLTGQAPVEISETFAMLPLTNGIMLGLWARETVEPVVTAAAGGSEIAFTVADKEALDELYSDCLARQIVIVQKPVKMDFGYTFVFLDPDGNRLRVFVLAAS